MFDKLCCWVRICKSGGSLLGGAAGLFVVFKGGLFDMELLLNCLLLVKSLRIPGNESYCLLMRGHCCCICSASFISSSCLLIPLLIIVVLLVTVRGLVRYYDGL